MRRDICWTERLEDRRIKRDIRVSISGGKIKWQFKRSDEEKWDYDTPASREDWDNLLKFAEARYRRNSLPLKTVELIKQSITRL